MAEEESKSPKSVSNPSKRCIQNQTPGDKHGILSPRFRSAAAMAGWDEEALLLASLVVEDTPERQPKHNRRSNMRFKTPPTNSKRKRRTQRQSPTPIAPVILRLDEEETPCEVYHEEKMEKAKVVVVPVAKTQVSERTSPEKAPSVVLCCMDRLREELSCAICLEICMEPSTTPCGHSFCKKCLKSATAKCGKRCPKCRQLISHGRSCTVNTVLWNTIQLLFPEEVETRKKALELNSSSSSQSCKSRSRSPVTRSSHNTRSSSIRTTTNNNNIRSSRITTEISRIVESDRNLRRRASPTQLEDAALAFRLQRQEFMEAFRETRETAALSTASAHLRAMASRAIQIRTSNRFL